LTSSRHRAESRATTRRFLCELANLREDGISRFRQMWGKYYKRGKDGELLQRRDELRMLWAKRSSYLKRRFTEEDWENAIKVPITKSTQALHEVSELRYPDPLEQVICEHWLSQKGLQWNVTWRPRDKRMSVDPRFLPAVLALGCLHFADRLCVCRNPACPARFFIGNRRDRKYCSDECARPAKRAAKLNWWHKNRSQRTGHRNGRGE
jgi:hypothetical protein